MDKCAQFPGEFVDRTPDRAYLSRADRASTPAPSDYVPPKVLRQRAKDRLDALFALKDDGQWVDDEEFRAADQMNDEAEEVSRQSLHPFKSYCGGWQNVFPSTRASAFEMVLQDTLGTHYGIDEQQIDTIMRDRRPKRKGQGKGGASTPARAQAGRGGKGGGGGARQPWRGGANGGKGEGR